MNKSNKKDFQNMFINNISLKSINKVHDIKFGKPLS